MQKIKAQESFELLRLLWKFPALHKQQNDFHKLIVIMFILRFSIRIFLQFMQTLTHARSSNSHLHHTNTLAIKMIKLMWWKLQPLATEVQTKSFRDHFYLKQIDKKVIAKMEP